MPVAQPRLLATSVGLSVAELHQLRHTSPVKIMSKVEPSFVAATPAWLQWDREAGWGLGIDRIDLVVPTAGVTLRAELRLVNADASITEDIALGHVGATTGGWRWIQFSPLLVRPDVDVSFRFADIAAGHSYSVIAHVFRWKGWQD